jgi:arylsulfatase A-like enzyme
MPRLRRRAAALLALGVGLAGAAGCQRTPPREPYNVVVIVMDTVRGDHVSANGYARKTTPAIDALAAEGTNFRQAISVAPRTWQSFASILTGLYPPRHGVRFIYDDPMKPDVPSLATTLGAKGYQTGAFDTVPFIRGITGGHGFGEYIDSTLPDWLVMGAAWNWINDRRDQRFFVFVRLNAAHWPYVATAEQLADFDPCDGHDHTFNQGGWTASGMIVGKDNQGFLLADKERYRKKFYAPGYDAPTIHHMIAHYDAALRNTDALIGNLMVQMRQAGLLERTIVVVTADHGEGFGEHGYFTHGPKLDDAAVRVPLVIRLPAGFPGAKRGQVVDDLVRVVDVAPTVLDVLGIESPQPLDGATLLPALTGAAVPPLWGYAESEKSFIGVDPDAYIDGVPGKVRMARDQDWKLILVPRPEGPEYRLYDLRADPDEATNVYDRHPDKAAELLHRLQPILTADIGDKGEPQLTDSQKEHLRQLGYR